MIEDEGGQEGCSTLPDTGRARAKGIVAGGDAPWTPCSSRHPRSVGFLSRGRNQLPWVTRKQTNNRSRRYGSDQVRKVRERWCGFRCGIRLFPLRGESPGSLSLSWPSCLSRQPPQLPLVPSPRRCAHTSTELERKLVALSENFSLDTRVSVGFYPNAACANGRTHPRPSGPPPETVRVHPRIRKKDQLPKPRKPLSILSML
jgi:hypothetical protein